MQTGELTDEHRGYRYRVMFSDLVHSSGYGMHVVVEPIADHEIERFHRTYGTKNTSMGGENRDGTPHDRLTWQEHCRSLGRWLVDQIADNL